MKFAFKQFIYLRSLEIRSDIILLTLMLIGLIIEFPSIYLIALAISLICKQIIFIIFDRNFKKLVEAI